MFAVVALTEVTLVVTCFCSGAKALLDLRLAGSTTEVAGVLAAEAEARGAVNGAGETAGEVEVEPGAVPSLF
jgi:microcystin degradation protein MlrC